VSSKDEDPYVRKTAALCVAKLFDLNPAIAIDNGLISILQDMLSDRNPMVGSKTLENNQSIQLIVF
jgi:vesicle coat complex subunit